MRIAAGCIALLVAIILLGSAYADFREDTNNAAANIDRAFREIHDDAALNRDLDEAHARTNSQEIRAVAGAAFLIGGLFIFGSSRRKKDIT